MNSSITQVRNSLALLKNMELTQRESVLKLQKQLLLNIQQKLRTKDDEIEAFKAKLAEAGATVTVK